MKGLPVFVVYAVRLCAFEKIFEFILLNERARLLLSRPMRTISNKPISVAIEYAYTYYVDISFNNYRFCFLLFLSSFCAMVKKKYTHERPLIRLSIYECMFSCTLKHACSRLNFLFK